MKLIASLTSPFARKIRVILIEKQLDFELHESIPWDANTDVVNYNPLGKVPALEHEGKVWTDSAVIADYLEIQEPNFALLPEAKLAAIEVKQVEALADGICEAAIAIFLERKRPSEIQDESWVQRQKGKLDRGLGTLNEMTQAKSFICFDQYSLADVAVVCLLEWLSFRMPEYDWELSFQDLAAYAKAVGSREAFKLTRPC